MELTGFINTALGAVIALGASAFVEWRRWRRERDQRTRDDRRAAYISFLNATAAASETLINIARGHDSDETAFARAGTVLRDSNVLSKRLELALAADDTVLAEVTRMVVLLRVYRDVVAKGVTYEADEFQEARVAFNEQRDRLTQLMRKTL
ncbi:hypothetical protein [Streptomyces fructofermentans]|uniref:hypothetical protein n=1 Tax=Streptomyces fructofermentans TaxID=152141 RepID=UPI001677798B|nr:hypothetical protein [Streptomyces fructofermentans]